MKRSMHKTINRQMERDNRKRPSALTLVPREEWPTQEAHPNLKQVWLSSKFLVQAYEENGGSVIRLSCCRTTLNQAGTSWQENITWDELMEIKRQIGHADTYAVEVFPPDQHIVNVANMRHLWLLPEFFVGWQNEKKAAA